jgi:hypothetical protein
MKNEELKDHELFFDHGFARIDTDKRKETTPPTPPKGKGAPTKYP